MENEYAEIRDGKTYLTDKAFDLYKEKCKYWLNFWGLDKEWDYKIIKADHYECQRDFKHRCVCITFAKSWDTDLYDINSIKMDIETSAFHEILHIVLAGMNWIGLKRKKHSSLFYAEEECVIRRLEKLFPLINKSEEENK